MHVKYFPVNGDADVKRETELKKSAVLEAFIARDHTPETHNVCVNVFSCTTRV